MSFLVPVNLFPSSTMPGGCWNFPSPSFLPQLSGLLFKVLGWGQEASVSSIPLLHRSFPKLHLLRTSLPRLPGVCSGLTKDPPLRLRLRYPSGSTSSNGRQDCQPGQCPFPASCGSLLHPDPQLCVMPLSVLAPWGGGAPTSREWG